MAMRGCRGRQNEMTRDVSNSPDRSDFLRCLREMPCYLPDLEDPDFWSGEFTSTQTTESGFIIMPYAVLGDVADAFRWLLNLISRTLPSFRVVNVSAFILSENCSYRNAIK